jgi:hypothetical protein
MNSEVTALERAFQLAKSGKYLSMSEIRKKLKKEGFSLVQIEGGALTKQLRELIKSSRENKPNAQRPKGESAPPTS